MNKRDFFIKAMLAHEYKRRAWVISAFSVIQEDMNAWEVDPYPYRIVPTPTGVFFVDPDANNQLTKIEDHTPNTPLFSAKEKLTITVHDQIANFPHDHTGDMETTYGRLLTNFIVLIYPFNNKIPYINKAITAPMLEDIIIARLQDTPESNPAVGVSANTTPARDDKYIYVDEYLKFTDAMFSLAGFTQLCVPASTKKTMTAAPGIIEYRKKLIEENKDRLYDPAVIAKIDAALVEYDKNYMKGDLGEGFLISKKSYETVRKKLFGMHGAETGFSDDVNVQLVQNSLSEGWDISKFPIMNDSLRAGSYNRGAQTMLGGESVKWLLRGSSNISITQEDCGSKLGNVFVATEKNYSWLVGFSVITNDGSVKVPDLENAKKYVGKKLLVRSPMFCKLDKTDYCAICCGDRLALNPKGLSAAVSEYGSAFLSLFMKKMHSNALSVQKLDWKTQIS